MDGWSAAATKPAAFLPPSGHHLSSSLLMTQRAHRLLLACLLQALVVLHAHEILAMLPSYFSANLRLRHYRYNSRTARNRPSLLDGRYRFSTMAIALRRIIVSTASFRSPVRSPSLLALIPSRALDKEGASPFSTDTMAKTIYDFVVKSMKGEDVSLKKYEGKVCLIVNVASKCGLTEQYAGLQKLYDDHNAEGLEVLGFPCNQFGGQEPGTEDEIKSFCSLKYNVTFDMFKKIDVNGANASPLYKFLKSEQHGFLTDDIKWNFTKFLVNRAGKPVKRYAPQDSPASIEADIKTYLAKDSKL